jgi:hypothetical protein
LPVDLWRDRERAANWFIRIIPFLSPKRLNILHQKLSGRLPLPDMQRCPADKRRKNTNEPTAAIEVPR